MKTRVVLTLALIAILNVGNVVAAPALAEKTVLLHSLDSAERLTLTWAGECPEKRIEVNADRRFISEGQGSLHLVAKSGKKAKSRYYAGVMIPLKGVDARSHTLLFDCWTSTPEATQAVYLRLYAPDRQVAASWSGWNHGLEQSPHLRARLDWGSGRGGFHWEEGVIKAPEASSIVAAEILIGTHVPNARFDIYVDNLRMSEARRESFTKVSRPKTLYPQTPLVGDGKPQAVIVSPSDAPLLALAQKLQEKIKETSGATLPIVKPEAASPAELCSGSAILLGNVCNNRAMLPLYARLYTPVDDFYPPEDGYLLHTVHDPWGTGSNVVIAGGATPAGVARAVEALAKAIKPGKDIVLPKLTLADLGKAETQRIGQRKRNLTAASIRREVEAARRAFTRGAHRGVAGHMGQYGLEYSRSGNDMLAQLYKELALAWYESYLAKPPIYGGPWGMDMDFHLMEILPAWDLLEESPSLSDDDRLKVTKILFEFITTDVVRKASGALRSKRVRHNHMTFPALGLFFAGDYFQKGYHAVEAESWLDIAEACFALQARSAKPYEDCNGYGWLVPYHTMRYALATLDPTYFANGNVRRQAEYAILTMDNLGYQVPYGDTGSFQCWWSEVPFLRGAAFYERDGRFAWTLQKKLAVRPDASLYEYGCRVTPKEPSDLLGVRAVPLDKMYWETFQGPTSIPLEKAVDKVVMRASFDPGRQYLLLDGLSNGGHKHDDGNSISRITDRARIWLADNDYIRSLPKFHNSVLVFKDGQASTIPPYCELEAAADAAAHGLSRTAVRNYNGVDWHRTIFWNKERFFLVFDDLVALEPGDYDFHCFWHAVGEVQLTADGLEVEQKGPRFFIKNAPGAQLKLSDDAELGKNWVGYEFARPLVHSLRQVKSVRLGKGQRVGFANLLYASDERAPQQFSIAGEENGRVSVRSKTLTPRRLSQNSPRPLAGEGQGVRAAGHEAASTDGEAVFGPDRIQPAAQGAVAAALASVRAFWQSIPAAPVTAPTAEGIERLRPGKVLWSFSPPDDSKRPGKAPAVQTPENLICLAAGDLDGDVRDEVLVGSDKNRLLCLGPDGKPRWSHTAAGRVTTAAVANLDGSKQKCAIAGSEDCQVYALGPDGKLRWSFEMPTYKGPGRVRVLFAADINGDGYDEVIAGGDNWRYYAMDRNGRELWHYESVHPSTAGAAADLDGDGKLETLCGTAYYWWHCAGPDGAKRWSYSVKGPHATVALSANLEGKNRRAAVFGSEDGNLHVLDPGGRPLWTFNVGDQVSGAQAVDLDGDGRDEIVATSMSFSVFAVNAAGKCVWRKSLGDPILSLTLADADGDGRKELIAGCQDGKVYVLDRQGKIVGRFALSAPAAGLAPARLGPDRKSQVLARTANAVTAIEW